MSTEERSQYRKLRVAYDAAFANWIVQVNYPNSKLAQHSAQVEDAHDEYRRSRDMLAEFLLVNGPGQRSEVEQLAYRIWEFAGRPADAAETNWHEAEQLITLKAAASK